MVSPTQDPGPDPAVARLFERQRPPIAPEPSLLRDPARALVVIGSVVAVVASPLPWLVKVGVPPPETVTGWSGLFDGFLIAAVAATLTWLVLNRDAANATTTLVRWLPPILGVTAAVLGVSALRNMDNQIEIWAMYGATGAYQPALFACLGGVAILALGTLLIGLRVLREPVTVAGGSRPIIGVPGAIASVVCGAVGGLVGAVGAALLLGSLDIDPIALSLPLILGTILGGLLGAHLGARLARTIRGTGT